MTLCGLSHNFALAEEIGDLDGGVFGAVGAVSHRNIYKSPQTYAGESYIYFG
jgi:hypothetical protein